VNLRFVQARGTTELRDALEGATRIAVDTEFHAEHRFVPELYLVQVAVPGAGAFVIDPRVEHVLEDLAPALLRPAWIVHGGQHDLRLLQAALGGLPDVVVDTQVAAGLVSTSYPATYASLVQRYLGRTLDKTETLSDWSRRPLSEAQLRYAAEDVVLLEDLWRALADALDAHGRSTLAAAAFADERQNARDPAPDDEAWLQIGASAVLEGAELAVLQELATWREERARASNQPPRTVLSDGALVELARRQPVTPESVVASRRLPKGLAKSSAELAERIDRARRRPAWAWPRRIHRRSREARVSTFLQLWASTRGQADSFAGPLAVPPPIADRIALAEPADRSDLTILLGSWRDGWLGDAIWDVLSGGGALRIDGRDVSCSSIEEGSAPSRKNS
jgi:ribonuclease D